MLRNYNRYLTLFSEHVWASDRIIYNKKTYFKLQNKGYTTYFKNRLKIYKGTRIQFFHEEKNELFVLRIFDNKFK